MRTAIENISDPARDGQRGKPHSRVWRWTKSILVALGMVYIVPILIAFGIYLLHSPREPWFRADRSSAGIAPDPMRDREAVVQVYTANTYGWRGIFGVHTWFALKPANAPEWERFEVVGFGVDRGRRAVRSGPGVPDARWYGNNPTLIAELRGSKAEAAIPLVRAAAACYPYKNRYTVWPGPNSNTFIAYIARRVPDLRVDLPANAIGKDYPVDGALARTPSGTGWQLSLGGILGIAAGTVEGVEVNLLGLDAGVDFAHPALRLPGLGLVGKYRYKFPYFKSPPSSDIFVKVIHFNHLQRRPLRLAYWSETCGILG